MNSLVNALHYLIGLRVPEHTDVVHWTVRFRDMRSIGWVLLAILVVAILVVWSYRRTADHVRPARRYTLATLRVLFLALLFCILIRPVLLLTTQGSVRRSLIVMCDSTASMQTADPRADAPDDLKRAALAKGVLDPAKGLGQTLDPAAAGPLRQVTRLDLLKSALKNDKMNLLARLAKEYDLRPFAFGSDPKTGAALIDLAPDADATKDAQKTPFAWVDRLDATSPVTPIGEAVRDVVNRTRGQSLAGVLLLTDGGNNSGPDPLAIVQTLARSGDAAVPVYAYGIGMSSPKDVIVANLFAPEVTFVKDEVDVTVRVRTQNTPGETGEVKLYLNNEVVDRKTITYDPDGEQTVAMKFTPTKAGEYDLRARIEPRDDEASKTNNEQKQRLRIIDGKIKVLYVEQSPRWEFKYLQAQLLRDRRVEMKSLLLEADPGVSLGENSPYLAKFPEKKEDLFKYDLIILGDVDPHRLTLANMEGLSDFVTKFGGGLLMIAGRNNAPQKYLGTPIEKMLPVVLDPTLTALSAPISPSAAPPVADRPIHVELSEKGKHSRMLQLSDKPAENVSRWGQLPPIYWDARVSRAKQAAEVLLIDPDPAKATRDGKMPVLAVQQYGLGQVIFMGTDNTWRWRKNQGDQFYLTLWGQMIQRLALPHLLGASKRTQLSSDKENYNVGERVTVYARLYNDNYEPITDEQVKGVVEVTGGEESGAPPREIPLRREPDQPGQYRGEFIAPPAGTYRFHVEKPADPKTVLGFAVTQSTAEQGDTAMNEDLLRKMADATGGQFFREETLDKLPDSIRLKSERLPSKMEIDLWSTPLYFLLLLGVVTAEWILRKMSQLK